MKTRFYYTIKDFMASSQLLTHTTGYSLMVSFNDTTSEGTWTFLNTIVLATIGTDDKLTRTLWCKYLYPEIYNKPITYLDVLHSPYEQPQKPLSGDQFNNLKNEFITDFAKWMNETYDVYKKKFDALAEYPNLVGDVVSEQFSRYNDTPQANLTGFDDDGHATNTNKIINRTQVGTQVQRLDELNKFVKNYYKQWVFDFCDTFVIMK